MKKQGLNGKEDSRIYFSYSQIYQISHALPIYRQMGGTFMVRNAKQWLQFKKYTRGLGHRIDQRSWLNTPPVIIFDSRQAIDRAGVLISASVYELHPDNRRIVTVYSGHGSGDKPYRGRNTYERMKAFDYHLITGPKYLQKLKDKGLDLPRHRLISIGNMRFDDYVNGVYQRRQQASRLGIRDASRLNILYAPTWSWGKGSLQRLAHRFAKELDRDYNLVVRPHSHDRMVLGRLKRRIRKDGLRHVYFSNPSNLARNDTMADFCVSDVLITDATSSIAYEYLITGKPVILIENDFEDRHDMPHGFKIQYVAERYHSSSPLGKQIQQTLDRFETKTAAYRELLERCFYFNDGRSTQRAVAFIRRLLEENQ